MPRYPDKHDLFTFGHTAKISLRTQQDLATAKKLVQSKDQTRPVSSDLEFTFRPLYDEDDSSITIKILRRLQLTTHEDDHERALAACLGLRGTNLRDMRIPPSVLNAYNEVAEADGVWVVRVWAARGDILHARTMEWYYKFFRDLAVESKGSDWDVADVERFIDFLAEFRGR